MNDLQNSIFEAMRLISENTNSHSEKTITIRCQIKEIVDAGIGAYLVEYLNNSFTVFSSNANIQYSVGTNVYVLVPDGDFSQEKIIIGAVNPSADNYVVGDNVDNYYDISDNFFEGQINEIELSSYDTLRPNEIKIELVGNNLVTVLDGYFKNYDNFEFSFKAKTNLHIDQRVNGNYGATLVIPMLAEAEDGSGLKPVERKFTLDVGTMIGNPYGLEAWTPQVMNFTIDTTQYFYDTSKVPYITYFCYNFKQDADKIDIKDIFLKDFCFKVVEALGEEDSQGYKLTLKASGGEYFLINQIGTDKEIKPTLRINGKVTSLEGKPHYWFIENANVYYNHEAFVSYGGPGWECINTRENIITTENGTQVFDYNVKQKSININESQLTAPETRIKCAIVYDNKVVSSIITLKDLNENSIIELYPTNGSNIFLKGAGYVELTVDIFDENISQKNGEEKESVKYVWQRFNQNGILLEDDSNIITVVSNNEVFEKDSKLWLKTKIKFPTRLVEGSNIIRCSAFRIGEGTETFIGSKELFISVEQKEGYKLVVENGNKIYKYDADGDSPMIEAYDGPISSRLYGIEALKYRVYKPDGVELTKDEYLQCKYTWIVPKNSMIETTEFYEEDDNYYYFKGQGNETTLPYGIARKFNKLKNDNNIILKVDFQGNLLDNIINLHFVKDGDSGTNGTKYAAVMVMGERESGLAYGVRDAAGRECKLKFYYDASGSQSNKYWHWYDHDEIKSFETRPDLNVRVYEDGSLLNPNDYTVVYSMFDERMTNPCFTIDSVTGELKPKDNIDISQDYCNIIQAEITVNKKGNESSVAEHNGTIIYAYYPIEISLANFYSTAMTSIDGGFSQVLYGTDGLKPQWDSAEPFTCNLNAITEDVRNEFDIVWDSQYHLHEGYKSYPKMQHLYIPDEKYDDGNSKNFVKVTISLNENNANSLNTKKIDLENQKNQIIDDIANLETLYNDLYAENTGIAWRFNAEPWDNRIDALETFYSPRMSAFLFLDNIENTLLEIEKYSNETLISDEYKNKYPLEHNYTILNFLGSEYRTLKNLVKEARINLEQNKNIIFDLNGIEIFNPIKSEKYILGFGLESAYFLKAIIDSLNYYVDTYNNVAYQFKIQPQINDYDKLILDLESYYYEINDVAVVLKQNFLEYLNTFKVNSSSPVLKDIIIKIKENCFEQYRINNNIPEQIKNKQNEKLNLEIKIGEINIAINIRNKYIVHIRPIVLLFNRYEMSHINGWDGNKIYTGNDNTFLLAPQVGAGKKENDNSFTGMIMGLRHLQNWDNSQVGLFGYHKGIQSLFMNAENGSAIFGKAGTGQIIIDPSSNKSLLYSSNYFKSDSYDGYTGLPNYNSLNKQGMLIDLAEPSIKWGNENFSVDINGHLIAKGGGTIAGWKISDSTLKSVNDKITLDSTDNDGKIYSHSHNELNKTNEGFYLGKDGISIGNSLLFTENDQILKIGRINGSRCWTINGSSSESYIAYNTSAYNNSGNSVYIGTNGISLGLNRFYVDRDGVLTSKKGSIGGWNIEDTTLSGGNTILNSNGTITCSNLIANTGGSIGGWNIGNSSLSANGITISANGSLYCSDYSWEINSNGTATFAKINVTGGVISFGDIEVTASGMNVKGSTGNSTIAGWKIITNKITKGSVGISHDTGNYAFWAGGTESGTDPNAGIYGDSHNPVFSVSQSGKLRCTDVNLTGEISATKGKIGNWTFDGSSISKSDGGYTIKLSNTFTGGSDGVPFLSSSSGSGYNFAAYASGNVTCSTLSCSVLKVNGVYLVGRINDLEDRIEALENASSN